MKRSRRNTFKDRCPECRINQRLCFCEEMNQSKKLIDSQIRVSIIMHYTERWLTSNTAYFAAKLLDNCEIIERGNIGTQIPVDDYLSEEFDYLYLFPTEDSRPIDEFKSDRPIHLVVPDGSWSKAKKIHKRERIFKCMPKYHLRDVGLSNYHLRKSPGEDYLCTYEAIAHALASLGEVDTKSQMLDFFDTFVQRVLASRRGDFSNANR